MAATALAITMVCSKLGLRCDAWVTKKLRSNCDPKWSQSHHTVTFGVAEKSQIDANVLRDAMFP